jgi:hypothetical protein
MNKTKLFWVVAGVGLLLLVMFGKDLWLRLKYRNQLPDNFNTLTPGLQSSYLALLEQGAQLAQRFGGKNPYE